jgi:uncharacterized membrane protein YjfL (UPF0719 family)
VASYDVSVNENCAAGDTFSGQVRFAVSIAESVDASDEVSQYADWNVINSVGSTTWTLINSSMSP